MSLDPGPFGRYEIRSLIGRGGMGEVYLAEDPELGRPVAVKLLPELFARDQELRQRFRQEARAASALNHPNIVTVHEVGTEAGVPYMVMEFVDGVTLRERIAEGALAPQEALGILLQVSSALAAAEAARIVHRDVKPENVILRHDGIAKVLDFGLAKRRALPGADSEKDTLVYSVPEMIVGTVTYMSPEQVRGLPVDSRSDVWSSGVVLYEMLTGRPPFKAPTAADTIVAILNDAIPPLGEDAFSDPVRRLLERCLSKDLEGRISSCTELLRQVRETREALSNGAESKGPRESGPWREISARLHVETPRRVVSLPVPPTRFVGRETEAAAVAGLLRDPEVRLVTLTGPGGTGKTRLALHLAETLAPEFPDGVAFVPLGSVADAALVPSAVARQLGLVEVAGAVPLEVVKEHLHERRLLLVLDNFEQVVAAAPAVSEIVSAAPGVKVLVTSRAVLRLRGERESFVPPLRLPDPDDAPDLAGLGRISSVALFVNRAQAVKPDFVPTPQNAPAIVEICRRLEGLPLALELAAARVKLLSPESLLARLSSRLGLLTGGAADLPERQKTMRSTIDWGVNLLTEPERTLFRRLTVFVNGFTLAAAEEVAGGDALGVDVLEGVSLLLDNSLLRREESLRGEPRYLMLETIREYGLELLGKSGEEEALRQRHAAFFVRMAGEAEAALQGEHQLRYLERLEAEHDNLLAALRWAFNRNETETLLRLAASLWRFWYLHGHYGEGRGWQEAALRAGREAAPELRTRALVGAGALAFLECDYARAREVLDESLALARDRGDRRSLADSLQYLGSIGRELGKHAESVARHRESLEIWRELGDERGVARSLNYIGFASWLAGDLAEADRACREALAIFRRLRDFEGTAWALLSLASVARYRGNPSEARTLCQESLLLAGEIGYKEGTAWSFDILGNIARHSGQLERSAALLRQSFALHRELGDRWRMASVLDGLVAHALARRVPEKAARMLGAADALRDAVGTPIPPVERPAHAESVAEMIGALGAERFQELRHEGRHTPLDQLLA